MKGQMTAGILASILAALLFTAMDVSAKALGHLGMGEITFIRGLAGLLFIPLIARGEGMPLFSGKDRGLLHLRGLMGAFGILLFFYSLPGLTLGDAEILVQLSAFFMCILSPIFLKTRLPGKVIIWLFVIAAGAAIVLRIWNFQAFNGYAVLGVISSFCSACAYTCIGKLTEKGGHSGAELVFYFQVYSMAGGALLMTGHMVMPLGGDWAWILLLRPLCPGGPHLGMYPHTAGDCDLCHVYGSPFPYPGRLGPVGRKADCILLDRRGRHRPGQCYASLGDEREGCKRLRSNSLMLWAKGLKK